MREQRLRTAGLAWPGAVISEARLCEDLVHTEDIVLSAARSGWLCVVP